VHKLPIQKIIKSDIQIDVLVLERITAIFRKTIFDKNIVFLKIAVINNV